MRVRVPSRALFDLGTDGASAAGVGDPAYDTVIAWTFLSGASREVFRDRLGIDAKTWARGRGWATWKSLIGLVPILEGNHDGEAVNRRIIRDVVADHEQENH